MSIHQPIEISISNQAQAIHHFFKIMDIEMVDEFLDDHKTYQNFEKELFISKLQTAFSTFDCLGDTHLLAFEGNCDSCDKTRTGYTFIGNNSKNYMSLIFDIANNKVNDIFECSDFKNKQAGLNLKGRVYIDIFIPF